MPLATYDSAGIRRVARRIEQISLPMQDEVYAQLRGAQEHAGIFQGRTAQAMDRELTRMLDAEAKLRGEIALVARQLDQYANELEALDARLAGEL